MLPLPIWDDQVHNGYKPIFSWLFITICVVVYIFQSSLPAGDFAGFITNYGTVPAEIMSGIDLYTLITNMFLHGSWMHLLWNMLYLYIFGDNIEATIGNAKFALFYILWGIVASMSHIVLSASSMVPAVWASWAISACLGAYLVMFPKANVKVIFLNALGRTMLWPAYMFLFLYIWLQIWSWMWAIGSTWWGTARWAHIWGFVFGAVVWLLYRKDASQVAQKKLKGKWVKV